MKGKPVEKCAEIWSSKLMGFEEKDPPPPESKFEPLRQVDLQLPKPKAKVFLEIKNVKLHHLQKTVIKKNRELNAQVHKLLLVVKKYT
jgi:hypothetical protein